MSLFMKLLAVGNPLDSTNVPQSRSWDEGSTLDAHDSSTRPCYPDGMAKKKPTRKKADAEDAVSFESSLMALKEILSALEEGQLPLSESLEKYEAGIRHLRHCDEALKKAKSRIELLVRVDTDGQPVTKPFEHSATIEEVSKDEEDDLQKELDEETGEEGDWDGGLF